MQFSWDETKNRANQRKHGISFDEAEEIFRSDDYLEISTRITPRSRTGLSLSGSSLAAWSSWSGHRWTKRLVVSSVPDRRRGARRDSSNRMSVPDMTDIPELTEAQFARAISARLRRRLAVGHFESGEDVVALRRFAGLTQTQFAQAIGISVHTLRNWEQGRRRPEGPAIALLRIAARHPRIIRENVESAA